MVLDSERLQLQIKNVYDFLTIWFLWKYAIFCLFLAQDHRDNSTLSLFKKQMIKEMEMVVASFMSVDENEQGL